MAVAAGDPVARGVPVAAGLKAATGVPEEAEGKVAAGVGESVAAAVGSGDAAAVGEGVEAAVAAGELVANGEGTAGVLAGVATDVDDGEALLPVSCRPEGMVGVDTGVPVLVTTGDDAGVAAGEVPAGQRLQVEAQ